MVRFSPDRLGKDEAAFAQDTLRAFRERLIRSDMDRRLLERTVEFARRTKAFDWKKLPKDLRVAIDSSPLEGAGRVEDTINLLGHAARNVVGCAADLLGWSVEKVAVAAGIPVLLESSVKKGLDVEWSDPDAKGEVLGAETPSEAQAACGSSDGEARAASAPSPSPSSSSRKSRTFARACYTPCYTRWAVEAPGVEHVRQPRHFGGLHRLPRDYGNFREVWLVRVWDGWICLGSWRARSSPSSSQRRRPAGEPS